VSVYITGALWDMPLPPGEKIIALALGDIANHDGFCWPSIDRLARQASVSRSTAVRSIAKLEARGLIRVERGDGRGNTSRYWFNLDKLERVSLRNGSLGGKGVNGDEKRVSPRHPNHHIEDEPSDRAPHSPPRGAETLQPVFLAWKEATGRNGTTILDGKRVRAIKGRLSDGFTVEQLVAAMRAIPLSDFHNGRHEKTKNADAAQLRRLTELTLHLRDADHVETLLALAGDRVEPGPEPAPRVGYVASDEELLASLDPEAN
jgi:Helix-turn-helix domain